VGYKDSSTPFSGIFLDFISVKILSLIYFTFLYLFIYFLFSTWNDIILDLMLVFSIPSYLSVGPNGGTTEVGNIPMTLRIRVLLTA
jgi:hypothetical protein